MAHQFDRVSFAEHVEAANPPHPDPVARGLVAVAARRLEPLHKIQVAFDQMVRNVEDAMRRRAETGAKALDPATRAYVRDEFDSVARHANALEAAHGAARSMLAAMAGQLEAIDEGLSGLAPALAPAIDPEAHAALQAKVAELEAELARRPAPKPTTPAPAPPKAK